MWVSAGWLIGIFIVLGGMVWGIERSPTFRRMATVASVLSLLTLFSLERYQDHVARTAGLSSNDLILSGVKSVSEKAYHEAFREEATRMQMQVCAELLTHLKETSQRLAVVEDRLAKISEPIKPTPERRKWTKPFGWGKRR